MQSKRQRAVNEEGSLPKKVKTEEPNVKPNLKTKEENHKSAPHKYICSSKKNGVNTGNKFQKLSKSQKQFLKIQGAPQEKPADWNQYKKEKKELRLKRKAGRRLVDVITKAKIIGEKIRVKKLEGAERARLISELHQLLGNQESYVKFVLSHDMARILQYMLKFGSAKIREEISNEIIPATVRMLQSQYGKFVVKCMLKYSNHDIRSRCIQNFYGNAVKLTSHAVSSPVFEYAYTEYATPIDKSNLIQEFFGDMYKQTKDVNVKHLRDVYKDSNDIKAAALSATKANLQRILNKGLLDSGLVQSVVSQFLSECNAEDRTELISQLVPHIVVLSNSKDGAKAAMLCLWQGSNKDRKIAMKAMKEHVFDMCKHEHAHTTIISLLDSSDDTVLLNKVILSEIISKADELISDEWGRRVLAYMVAPTDRIQFHPLFINELETGRKGSTCKKDVDVRRKEISGYCIKGLLDKIVASPKVWCMDPKALLLTALVLKHESAMTIAVDAYKALAELTVDAEIEIGGQRFIENSGISMSLKKLVHNDKNIDGEETFGKAIVNALNDSIIKSWIQINRACFLLADIFSNNNESVQNKLKLLLEAHLQEIQKQKTKGAELLLQKMA